MDEKLHPSGTGPDQVHSERSVQGTLRDGGGRALEPQARQPGLWSQAPGTPSLALGPLLSSQPGTFCHTSLCPGPEQGRGGRAHVQEQFKVAVHEGDPDEQTAPPEVPQLWDEEHRGYEI